MIKALGSLAVAILLAATVSPGELGAFTLKPGTLACGFDDCVDIWKFTCGAGATKYVYVYACDAGGTLDDRMTLTAIRKSADANDGKGDIDNVSVVNSCAVVALTRPVPGPVNGLATVSSYLNAAPFEYNLYVYCYDKNLTELADPTVTNTTNQ